MKSIAKGKQIYDREKTIFDSSAAALPSNFFVIDVGAVTLKRKVGGTTFSLDILKYPSFFGAEEFLGVRANNFYTSIQQNTCVYIFDQLKLKTILMANPKLGMRFFLLLCYKLTKVRVPKNCT